MLKNIYICLKLSKKIYLYLFEKSEGKSMNKKLNLKIKNRVQKLMNLIWGL